MVRVWSVAVMIVVVLVSSLGCGQGVGDTPSGPTPRTPSTTEPPKTTSEQTASEKTRTLGGLECPNGLAVSGVYDYVEGAKGKKGPPVELARREFSKHIEEGDTVRMGERSAGGRNAAATVGVIREGRLVARIEYRHAGGGWLKDYSEYCANF
jgi:hypothetical protein